MGKVVSIYGGTDPRQLARYSVREAAHYLHMPTQTLLRWTSHGKGLIETPGGPRRMLSFHNLVEAHVLHSIRRFYKVPWQRVVPAIEYCRKEFGPHPLLREDFETDGIDLFVTRMQRLVNVSKEGQVEIYAAIGASLKRIDRDPDGLASRLFPYVRDPSNSEQPRLVVVDPRIAFGAPVIAGTGIPTRIIAGRMKAGESISGIAADYAIKPEQVEDAVRCEIRDQAA